jgi:hypothetical protein
VLRVGSRVSALVGELGYWNGSSRYFDNGKKRKRYKQRLFGTVTESKADRNWLVRWDQTGVATEEEYSTYKLKYEGQGSDLRPTNQEAAAATQQQQQARQQQARRLAGERAQERRPARPEETTAPPPEETRRTAEQPEQKSCSVHVGETRIEGVGSVVAAFFGGGRVQ